MQTQGWLESGWQDGKRETCRSSQISGAVSLLSQWWHVTSAQVGERSPSPQQLIFECWFNLELHCPAGCRLCTITRLGSPAPPRHNTAPATIDTLQKAGFATLHWLIDWYTLRHPSYTSTTVDSALHCLKVSDFGVNKVLSLRQSLEILGMVSKPLNQPLVFYYRTFSPWALYISNIQFGGKSLILFQTDQNTKFVVVGDHFLWISRIACRPAQFRQNYIIEVDEKTLKRLLT